MKNWILLLFVLFGLKLQAQPKLELAYSTAGLPDLTIDQLSGLDEIITYDHHEGILLYNKNNDTWRLYENLLGYEEFGNIHKLFSFEGTLIVSMQLGSLIISENGSKTIDVSIVGGVSFGDNLLLLTSNPLSDWENRSYTGYGPHGARQLLEYNLATGAKSFIKLSISFNGIKSVELIDDNLYVLIINGGGEGNWSGPLKVSLEGEVTFLTDYGSNIGAPNVFQAYKNSMYLHTSGGLYKLNQSDSLVKVMDNTPGLVGIKSNHSDCIFLVPHLGHRSEKIDIAKLDLNDLSIKSSSVTIPESWELCNGTKAQVYKNILFYNSDLTFTLFRSGFNDDEPKKRYSIRDGLTAHVGSMAEDSTELWFVSSRSGIYRFSKTDEIWTTYTQHFDIPIDDSQNYRIGQFSLNDDYVFFAMQDHSGRILKYLIFDRNTETFSVLTEEGLVDQFFYYEGRFAKYTGEEFMSDEDVPKFMNVFKNGSKWAFLLFLYDLSLSGVDDYHYRHLLIREKDYNLLSLTDRSNSKMWHKGVMVMDNADKSWKIYTYPQRIYDFDSHKVPYQIFGDSKQIYGSGQGGDCKGIFSYDFETGVFRTEPSWFRTFFDISRVCVTDKYVLVGSYENKLHALNRQNNEIIDLTGLILGSPRGFAASDSYIYVGTSKQTYYFDPDLKNHGVLYSGSTAIHKTDFNTYFSTNNKVFRLVEK